MTNGPAVERWMKGAGAGRWANAISTSINVPVSCSSFFRALASQWHQEGKTIVEIVDGGYVQSVLLRSGDSLADLPASHRDLISSEIGQVFADPVAYLEDIARRCPFPAMAHWLRGLLVKPRWELECHVAAPPYANSSIAVFRWRPVSGLGGLIPERRYPDSLQVWGHDGCGDMLVYTDDGRGGWLEHEEGYVRWIGSIAETIEWVFAELLAGREPDAYPKIDPGWQEHSG
jgi:hypothetical protein